MAGINKNNLTEEQKEMMEDIDFYKQITAFTQTDAGKKAIKALQEDIIVGIEKITNNVGEKTQQEFIATALEIKTKLDFYKLITKAKSNEEALVKIFKDSVV